MINTNQKRIEYVKVKNQKGAISIFTVLSMIFFLVFVLGIFTFASRRNQTQVQSISELRSVYRKDADKIYDTYTKEEAGVVPIYGYYHFGKIGSMITMTIDDKNYPFNSPQAKTSEKKSSYILKNNIIENLDSIITSNRYESNLPVFNDYMIYNSDYNVDDNGFDIYYRYNGAKYKLIAYSRQKKELVPNTVKNIDRFNIIDKEINLTDSKYGDITTHLDSKNNVGGFFNPIYEYNYSYTYRYDFLAINVESNGYINYQAQSVNLNETLHTRQENPEIPKAIESLEDIEPYNSAIHPTAKGFYIFVKIRE